MAYAKYILAPGFLAVGLLCIPASAFASVLFSEVMYDVPGTDTGHEWVEIQNAGSGTLDLAGWKFFEANTNHGLSLVQGAGIPPGGYGVIADDPTKFLADWPSYTGVLFDSSFSLSNTGEALALKDDSGTVADSLSYDPTLGAAGDGNTLQWDGAKWVAAAATPGAAHAGSVQSGNTGGAGSGSGDSGGSSSADSSDTTAPPQGGSAPLPKSIFADAGPDRTLFVGVDAPFTATAIGLTGDPLENARYVWTFGDGGSLEGPSVRYRYSYPGVYAVILDVSSGKYAAEDRMSVNVIPVAVSIPVVSSEFVEIKNDSSAEVDLGGWILAADGKTFTVPPHTFVAPKESVLMSGERTGIAPSSPKAFSLEYPNGAFAASYEAPLIAARISGAEEVESLRPPVLPEDQPGAAATSSDASASASTSVSTVDDSHPIPPVSLVTPEMEVAAPILADPGKGWGIFPWLGALLILVLFGLAVAFYSPIKKKFTAKKGNANQAR